jgi:hypothetical protein
MAKSSIAVLTFAVASLIACADDSTGPDGTVRFETSFESGLDGFTPDGTDLDDPPVEWSIERTDEHSDEGSWSVRLDLDNLNDAGKIWLERSFSLEPGAAYDVNVSYAFGTSDFGDFNLWTLITGVTAFDPETVSDLAFQGETGTGEDEDLGVVWLEKSHTFSATASPDGELWVSLGVWGTWETHRTHYFDDVRIVFTPR